MSRTSTPRATTAALRAPWQPALLLATASLAAAPAPPGTIQSYDVYKSWLVACDNTLSCVAKGFGDAYQVEIKIERGAGPRGKLVASIGKSGTFALADIKIDGAPADLAAPAWRLFHEEGSEENSATSDDLGAIRALAQRLRNASKLTFGGEDMVPLDGFAAAMLRLDERQGRLGGATALMKPGPAPASRVLAPPPVPTIPNHPIRARLANGEDKRLIATVRASQKPVFEKEQCQANPRDMEASAHALDAGRALVLIPCLMGAYQGSSIAFIAPRGGGPAQRLVAPTPYVSNLPDRSDADFFTEGGFDPDTGTLAMAAKGRGLADCGLSASWIWDGERFRLAHLAFQEACGGMAPGDWPTLFRSER